MFDRIVAALTLAVLFHGAGAQTLSDPMRPWQQAVQPAPTQSRGSYDLSAILYSPERRVAVINGRTVSEGDRVGAAKVRRINRRSLELDERGRRIRLVLAAARTRARSSQ